MVVEQNVPIGYLMEICNFSLDTLLPLRDEYGRPDMYWIINFASQAACGIAHLHKYKIVHNDIKPAKLTKKNLFILNIF